MKKTLLIAVAAIAMLAGCSGDRAASKYEEMTREQLQKVIRKVAKNPDNYKINDIEVAYRTDSICILRFNGVGENSWGGTNNSRNEFVMVTAFKGNKEDQVTMCMLRNLEDLKSVMVAYKEMQIGDMSESKVRIETHEDSLYYYCGYLAVSGSKKAGYSTIVKEMTNNQQILKLLNDNGL